MTAEEIRAAADKCEHGAAPREAAALLRVLADIAERCDKPEDRYAVVDERAVIAALIDAVPA